MFWEHTEENDEKGDLPRKKKKIVEKLKCKKKLRKRVGKKEKKISAERTHKQTNNEKVKKANNPSQKEEKVQNFFS